MGYKLRTTNRQRLTTLQRGSLLIGAVSMLTTGIYLALTISTAQVTSSRAGSHLLEQDPVNNGEILLAFTWDKDPVRTSDIGPEALRSSPYAECISGSGDQTFGLSAGNTLKPIQLEIEPTEQLNAGGIDISLDYRRLEPDADFYSRGKEFNFGMKDGILYIQYKLKTTTGKTYQIDETTRYDIAEDNTFRNYRFIYNPATGRGEIMVDKATVWTNQAPEQSQLCWKTSEPIVIGKGMNGNGKPMVTLDNLKVRSTGTANTIPMDLLSFSAEFQGDLVMVGWYTARENGTKEFKIERSSDTKTCTEIGRIQAAGKSNTLKAYAVVDKAPAKGVAYYRIAMSNPVAYSKWIPVISPRTPPEQAIAAPPTTAGSTSR